MTSDDWQRTLRAKGYRLTPQRELVLEAVRQLGHATPDEILVEVRKIAGGVNASTVYRTLDLLEELELVRHTHLGHGAPTYHHVDDGTHLHLVCRKCDSVIEVDIASAADMVERLDKEYGFQTDVAHFSVFGLCESCRP